MAEHSSRVALVQMQCDPEPEKNLAKAIARIRDAAKKGAQIVCLPELFRSQYFCQSEDHANFALAEEIPGPTTDLLGKLAAELKVVIIASLFEKRGAGVYHNTAAIIDADGKLLGRYRKMHIPDDPLYHEKFYFTPGDLGFQSWKTSQGKHRRLRLLGPMVSGSGATDRVARRTRFYSIRLRSDGTRARKSNMARRNIRRGKPSSAATRSPTVALSRSANRVGHERPIGGDGIEFWGQSFIAAPSGEIIAKGSVDKEELVMADIDWKRVDEHRTHWPFLRDRRIDAYAEIQKRMIDD